MVVGLLGTDFSSNNRGCGALGYATTEILKKQCAKQDEKLEIYAFLYRMDPLPVVDNEITMHYILIKPKKVSFWKNTVEIFKKCDFVLDFTGGDSFSDIYGSKRFVLTSIVKQLAIWSRAKFVMAPQTIGPFKRSWIVRWAKHILNKSDICFVRDTISAQYVKNTFGVTPVITTDVAFSLPYSRYEKRISGKIRVGINPSGLLWDGTEAFCASKHITINYKQYISALLEVLCNDDSYEVILIPHVFSNNMNDTENDLSACHEIRRRFPSVEIYSDYVTPMEAKTMISSLDVFIGARMHATIAAFSTGVATIPVSYSRKFEGLYQDLDYPYIIGATYMETQNAIDKTLEWVENKDMLKNGVRHAKSIIEKKQQEFIDVLSDNIKKGSTYGY